VELVRLWPRKWPRKTLAVPVLGKKIEIIAADHQNKPDIGANIARNWIDRQGVDAIVPL
jgi:ABC-type branched-subunit amino acid transport system substrate-binding protein